MSHQIRPVGPYPRIPLNLLATIRDEEYIRFYLSMRILRSFIRINIAARNALKRKKVHEHSLEQTNGQISMLEQQIYSIESANINQETLVAMKNAGKAIKEIHGKMTIEDVDTTMYVTIYLSPIDFQHILKMKPKKKENG